MTGPRPANPVAAVPDDIKAQLAGGGPLPHIGLVGCGRWGANILRDLRALGCPVTVVARPGGSSVHRARAGGAHAIVAKVEALPDVAGAVVATINAEHAAAIRALLPREIPIFVEKPLCEDPLVADQLAAAAPQHLFVMDKWRYHTGVAALKTVLHDHRLGPLAGIEIERTGWGVNHPDTDPVWILLPHDLAIVLELLGELPEPRHAIGFANPRTGAALLTGSLGRSPWVQLRVSGRDAEFSRRIRLICRDGVAELSDGYSESIRLLRGELPYRPEVEHVPFPAEMPLLRELAVFVEFLRGGPAPRSSAAEGAAVVRTIQRLRNLAGLA